MIASAFRIRRATVDDLATLKAMWQDMRITEPDLEKRLTEFQVAEGPDGEIVGAIGFQITQRHGLIHSEAFTDFGVAETVRPLLWQRLGALALNHGVVRYWTLEKSPFWTHNGLHPAAEDELARLPSAWDRSSPGWLTLRLKDEDAIASLDKEFDMFAASEKQRTTEALSSARKLRLAAFWLVGGLAVLMIGVAAYLVLTNRINLQFSH